MKSKRRFEGYLQIDNRASFGVTDETNRALGLDLPVGCGHGMFEAATYTCSHCQSVVVIEPRRTRERAYCSGCDHYICDGCGVQRAIDFKCRTWNQLLDEVDEKTVRGIQSSIIVL